MMTPSLVLFFSYFFHLCAIGWPGSLSMYILYSKFCAVFASLVFSLILAISPPLRLLSFFFSLASTDHCWLDFLSFPQLICCARVNFFCHLPILAHRAFTTYCLLKSKMTSKRASHPDGSSAWSLEVGVVIKMWVHEPLFWKSWVRAWGVVLDKLLECTPIAFCMHGWHTQVFDGWHGPIREYSGGESGTLSYASPSPTNFM